MLLFSSSFGNEYNLLTIALVSKWVKLCQLGQLRLESLPNSLGKIFSLSIACLGLS